MITIISNIYYVRPQYGATVEWGVLESACAVFHLVQRTRAAAGSFDAEDPQ